jgi:hypothetical protein
MNAELIEKLKHNERPFGLCTKEEQECFKEVRKQNCLFYSVENKWLEILSSSATTNHFPNEQTYRIKSDYQPQPEYMYEDVIIINNELRAKQIGGIYCVIDALVRLPDFRGFGCVSDQFKETWIDIRIDSVAFAVAEGKRVQARFVKGGST